ncbi:MAG: heparinase II/III family protein [Blastocatellia bacterium]|nr:heparinase II/III family protein [Blastocatellia bacterium]
MASPIAQIKKLRGRSLKELGTRGRQELSKLGERLLGSRIGEMSDTALLQEIAPRFRNRSAETTAALILERLCAIVNTGDSKSSAPPDAIPQSFFPSLSHHNEIIAAMESRFPAERRALIERADRAVAGRFDLMGFKDLSFGDPIDWHLEPTSSKRAPLDHWSRIDYLAPDVAGDKKITWELNRHAHFVTLGQAYSLTGDERYARCFVAQASSWMDANPPNLGINWASSLELAFRSIAWLWALHFFANSKHLTPEFVLRSLKHLAAHGAHIESYLSHYFSPNTHLTGEALGLFYLGTALPELRRAKAWRETGLGILLDQLSVHVRPDGVYFEQSSYYHRYSADFYTHLIALARADRLYIPREVEERLSLLMDHLMWITRPDGSSPLIGDDDGGRLISLGERRPNDFRDTLTTGAAMFGRGDWKFVAGDAAVETLWLLGPEGLASYDAIKSEPPLSRSHVFLEGGYFVMRDGWARDSSYLLIDCGPHGTDGCGHAHADALAFEFAARGTTWLVDPGTFTYTGDQRSRDWFRSTEAHNTVTVDNESQSVGAGPFSWNYIARSEARHFIAGDGPDYFEGAHAGFERLADPVTHARSILFVKEDDEHPLAESLPPYLMVRDRFTAAKRHHYAARYHFSPECRAETDGYRVKAKAASEAELEMFAFGPGTLVTRVEEGRVSRCYGHCETAQVAVVELESEGEQEFITFLIPQIATGKVLVERKPSSRLGDYAFEISSATTTDLVMTGNKVGDVECEAITARAAIVWARFSKGDPHASGRGTDRCKFVRCSLFDGKKIEIRGVVAFSSPTTVRYCAIRSIGDRLEIAVEEASLFELKIHGKVSEVSVNGTSHKIDPNRRSATADVLLRLTFARVGWGWELINEYMRPSE